MSDQKDAGASAGYWAVGRRERDGKFVRIAYFETREEAVAYLGAMQRATPVMLGFYLLRSDDSAQN